MWLGNEINITFQLIRQECVIFVKSGLKSFENNAVQNILKGYYSYRAVRQTYLYVIKCDDLENLRRINYTQRVMKSFLS